MNDLIIKDDFARCFPTMVEGIKKAQDIFSKIHSLEDIERIFLRGQGLSPNTYRSYLTSVKQFYDFTEGLNPLQIMDSDIERFYDDIMQKVDRNTAYLKIAGLKKFFKGIQRVIPFYTSPFDIMNQKLKRKLSRTKKGNRTKKALSKRELQDLLEYLKQDESLKGRQNYAVVLFLFTTGLRAFELCQLRWKDLQYFEGKYTVTFVQKGGGDAEQEVHPAAIELVTEVYQQQFHRDPRPEDHLFHSLESYPGKAPAALNKATLWVRLHDIGKQVRQKGIIKRELQFSAHLFRRTFATLLNREGMDLKSLQLCTRHSNIETLAKHYVDNSESSKVYLDKILKTA